MVRRDETFCGCCKFKVGCIVIAVCRVVMTVAASVALFVIYFDDERKEEILQQDIVSEGGLVFYMIIAIPVSIITIRFSYWFIRGAISTNKADIDRMSSYVAVQLITIAALVVCFNLICFFLAMIEFYFMYCSSKLIRERKENALNDPETPPPQYDSCVNDTKPQTSASIHLDEEGQPSQSAGAEPDTNPFNNIVVETVENHMEKAKKESENNILKNDRREPVESTSQNAAMACEGYHNVGGESKENLGFESEENLLQKATKKTNENSIQNDAVAREENPIKNVGGELKENVGCESDESTVTNLEISPKVNS